MNKEVQVRIEVCRRERNEVLDLSGLGLTEIPKEVGELVWLKFLNLSNNAIRVINNLEKLDSIQILNLSQTKIKNLFFTENLKKVIQAETIETKNNSIT